jgi:hypothetical protein
MGLGMTKRKKHRNYLKVPMTSEDLPLEALEQMIQDGLIQDELPFELLASQYPTLLDKWYPGYPGMMRQMTPEDPMCLTGYIENGTVTFKDWPDLGRISLGKDSHLKGEYKVWLRAKGKSWFIYVVAEVEENSISNLKTVDAKAFSN